MRNSINGGPGINYILRLLQILQDETTSNEFARKSPYKYRHTHYSLAKDLIKAHFVISKVKKAGKVQTNTVYSLSFEGIMLLYFLERLNA